MKDDLLRDNSLNLNENRLFIRAKGSAAGAGQKSVYLLKVCKFPEIIARYQNRGESIDCGPERKERLFVQKQSERC